MSKGETSAFLVIWSQHLSECLPSFGVSWSAEALRDIGTLLTLLRPVNEDLSHLCPKKKKNQFLQTPKNNHNNNKKRSSLHADVGLSSLPGVAGIFVLPCRLQEDNHHSAQGGAVLFHGFWSLFPHVSKSHHSCLCLC